jgi:hypothetical protein
MEKYHTNATAVIMTFDTIQTEVRTLAYIYSHCYHFSRVGLIFVINLGQALQQCLEFGSASIRIDFRRLDPAWRKKVTTKKKIINVIF